MRTPRSTFFSFPAAVVGDSWEGEEPQSDLGSGVVALRDPTAPHAEFLSIAAGLPSTSVLIVECACRVAATGGGGGAGSWVWF